MTVLATEMRAHAGTDRSPDGGGGAGRERARGPELARRAQAPPGAPRVKVACTGQASSSHGGRRVAAA